MTYEDVIEDKEEARSIASILAEIKENGYKLTGFEEGIIFTLLMLNKQSKDEN